MVTDNIFSFPEVNSRLRSQLNRQYESMAKRRKNIEYKKHGTSSKSNLRRCNLCKDLFNLEDTVMIKYKLNSSRAYRVCISCSEKIASGNLQSC